MHVLEGKIFPGDAILAVWTKPAGDSKIYSLFVAILGWWPPRNNLRSLEGVWMLPAASPGHWDPPHGPKGCSSPSWFLTHPKLLSPFSLRVWAEPSITALLHLFKLMNI